MDIALAAEDLAFRDEVRNFLDTEFDAEINAELGAELNNSFGRLT